MQLGLTVYDIPTGDAGIDQTVQLMARLIHEGAQQPVVVHCVEDIARTAHVIGADPTNGYRLIAAIRRWLAARWRFVLDPDIPSAIYGIEGADVTELLHAPDAQLATIAARGAMSGDCDCAAILAGALCVAGNLEARIVCAGFGLDNVPPYVHTWCEARPFGGDEFLELDITRPSQQLPADAITRAASWSLS
jgi:hypothetical protein